MDLTGYTLNFSENFSDTSLDTNVWRTCYWWGGRSLPSNGEQQYFADGATEILRVHPELNPFSFREEDGERCLVISARPCPRPDLTDGLPCVSGMINTHGRFAQLHGYFEMRAKLPAGRGLWPAFWLLPDNGAWPPEIDVVELLGRDPSRYYVSAHWSENGQNRLETQPVVLPENPSSGFRTYGVHWSPETLVFYLDGHLVRSMKSPPGGDMPMYLLAGLAVGGDWPGAPDSTTIFPAELRIAHLRVYGPKPVVPTELIAKPDLRPGKGNRKKVA